MLRYYSGMLIRMVMVNHTEKFTQSSAGKEGAAVVSLDINAGDNLKRNNINTPVSSGA
jgi:uncharacterized protein related to proFAR isomerase